MLNRVTPKYMYKEKKKKKDGGVKGEGETAGCMLQFHWLSSPLSASTYIGCIWTERSGRPAAVSSRDRHETVASENCKSGCSWYSVNNAAALKHKMLDWYKIILM